MYMLHTFKGWSNKQSGATLIETMVSLFVLGVGLFGAIALQIKSNQQEQNSFMYAQAVVLANDITERIKSSATPDTEIINWKTRVQQLLPGGDGSVSGTTLGSQTITISFNEKSPLVPNQQKHTITFQSWL